MLPVHEHEGVELLRLPLGGVAARASWPAASSAPKTSAMAASERESARAGARPNRERDCAYMASSFQTRERGSLGTSPYGALVFPAQEGSPEGLERGLSAAARSRRRPLAGNGLHELQARRKPAWRR